MDVSRANEPPRPPGTANAYDRYGAVLDKLLRDTEDGDVMWTSDWKSVQDGRGGRDEYTVYKAETPAGSLLLHGMEEYYRALSQDHKPIPTAASPARRGEARLFLIAESGRTVPFPPVSGRAFQSVLDNLLTAVRYKVEGPVAEEFARRFLAGGDGSTASPA